MARFFVFLSLVIYLSPMAALAADWKVDAEESRLGFSGTQTGLPFEGVFRNWTAEISLDPEDLSQASIRVDIDMASVDAFDKQRNGALPGADWFDVASFPRAVFASTTVKHVQGSKYMAEGTLTIRGISKQVILPFTLDVDGAQARASGGLSLVRTDFGVGRNMWASGQWVGLEVKVTFRLLAEKTS